PKSSDRATATRGPRLRQALRGVARPSNPAHASAGYLTPRASPASRPARTARRGDGSSWNRIQPTRAAAPNAARDTSLSGAPIPLETAGTSSATTPAHQARAPRHGRASAVTLAANDSPSTHDTSRHAIGPRNSSATANSSSVTSG